MATSMSNDSSCCASGCCPGFTTTESSELGPPAKLPILRSVPLVRFLASLSPLREDSLNILRVDSEERTNGRGAGETGLSSIFGLLGEAFDVIDLDELFVLRIKELLRIKARLNETRSSECWRSV